MPRQFLDFFLARLFPNTLMTHIKAVKAIVFTLLYQKIAYNCQYQSLFIKVDKLIILFLYKSNNILTTTRVTNKFT